MCELITIAAAILFSILAFISYRKGSKVNALGMTALMFWGAAIMWAVDCFKAKSEGEPFFDISKEDTILGIIILAAGLLIFSILKFRESRLVSTERF